MLIIVRTHLLQVALLCSSTWVEIQESRHQGETSLRHIYFSNDIVLHEGLCQC